MRANTAVTHQPVITDSGMSRLKLHPTKLVLALCAMWALHPNVQASCGINGSAGTSGATGTAGGNGVPGVILSTSQSSPTITSVCGGNGGQGGGSSTAGVSGGAGGLGALGVVVSAANVTITTLTIDASVGIYGGHGGSPGAGGSGSTGTAGSGGSSALKNIGTITTFTNNGTLYGGYGGSGAAGSLTGAGGAGGASGNGLYNAGGTIGSLVNNGLISSDVGGDGGAGGATGNGGAGGISNPALYNGGSIASLSNSGTIVGSAGGAGGSASGAGNTAGAGGQSAAALYNSGSIASLTNSGTLAGSVGGAGGAATAAGATAGAGGVSGNGIMNYSGGTITNLTNTGLISAGVGGAGGDASGGATGAAGGSADAGLSNNSGATIGTLSNSGTISGAAGGAAGAGGVAGTDSNGLANSGTISTLNNTGMVMGGGTGGYGVRNSGLIESLVNSGTISSQSIGIRNTGTIGTSTSSPSGITNYGVITGGISNTGSISVLNNQQGSSGALSYTGALPANYNIIIASSSNYGKLSGTSLTGTTVFGVSALSTASAASLLNTTLSSVLTGVSATNLGLGSATTASGSSNGYSYILTETDLVNAVWSLTITAASATSGAASTSTVTSAASGLSNVLPGNTATLNTIGTSFYPVLAGGVLALSSGDDLTTALSLVAGSTIVHPSSGSAVLAGSISGAGSLTFSGSGTTVIASTNTYTGGTTIAGGILSVGAYSPTGTGDVIVAAPAKLLGTGTILGNIVVNGTLKPGNSPGYLATSQNVTFNAGSTYQQDIAGATQASSTSPAGGSGYYSFLSVGGSLSINAGATLAPALQNLFQSSESGYGSAAYVPSLGDRFRITTANGGISGTFSSLSQPTGLATGTEFVAFYNQAGNNSIDLAVIPSSYSNTLGFANSNTKSVAAALDQISAAQLSNTATTTQTNLLYATSSQTSLSLASFASSLSGEIYGAALAVVPQTAQRTQGAVLGRLLDADVRWPNGGYGSTVLGTVSPQNPLGEPVAGVSSNPSVDPVKDAAITYRPNVWGEIAYQYGNRSGDAHAGGYNSSLYQAVFGTEFFQSNLVNLGGGFALSTTGVSNSTGSGTVSQGSIFAYAKAPVLQDYIVDGMLSASVNSTNVTRNDPTSTASLKARNIMGNDMLLSVGLSRSLALSEFALTVTPYARITWQAVNQSPFDEGNSSAAALSVNGFSGNGVRGVIGMTVGSANKDPMRDDYTYKINLAVGADSNTLMNPALGANLAGISTSIQTANVGSAFAQLGLQATAKLSDQAYGYAGISGEARSGQTLGGLNLGLRAQF